MGAVGRFFGKRVASGTAALIDPLTQPGDTPALQYLNQIGRGVILGEPPRPDLSPYRADVQVLEQAGVPTLLNEAQREEINRRAFGLPVGSLAGYLLSPEGAALAAEAPVMAGMNLVGGSVLKPALRAAAEPLRGLPVVKQASEFVSTGSSLPKAYRPEAQRILREAEGAADLSAFERNKALGAFQSLPVEAQDRIQTAIEKRAVASLAPDEQAVAKAVEAEYAKEVASREAVGLRRNELGAHLTPEEQAQNVAFTKRILTPEARQELAAEGYKLKPYGSPITPAEAAPAGLGTGRMARRVSDPTLTTAEINAAHMAEGKARAFKPVVESTILGGAANDVRVMNAKIVKDLSDKFGVFTPDAKTSVGRHFGVSTGFTPEMKASLEMTRVPPQVDELIATLNKRLAPEEFGNLNRFWRGVNNQFKTWALFSPGFVSRNFQNNVIQTAIFGNMDPRTWTRAAQIRTAMGTGKGLDAVIKVGKAKMTVGQYIEDAIKRGVIGRGQVAQETASALTSKTRTLAGKIATAPFRGVRTGNQFVEDLSRVSFDLFNQGRGMNAIKSAERVDQVLFNYSNRLANPARNYLRRNAVPFVNWSAQIVPLFARTAIERPGSMGVLSGAMQKQNEKMGFGDQRDIETLGPDVAEQGGVVVGKGPGPNVKAMLPTGYGTLSVNELAPLTGREGAMRAADALAQQLYPQFGMAFGAAAGRDYLTGREFTGRPVTAPAALKSLWLMPGGAEFAAKHGIFIDDTGTVRAPDKLAFVLRGIPPVRLPSVLADVVSPGKGSETRVKSFALGYREVERNPAEGKEIAATKAETKAREKRGVLKRYPENVKRAGFKP